LQKIVKNAVSQNPKALHFASSRLQSNKAFVLDLVCEEPNVIRFADDILWDDKEIMLACVRRWGRALTFASEELQDDIEVVLTAIEQDPQAVEDASETLRNNRTVMKAAVEKAPLASSPLSRFLSRTTTHPPHRTVSQDGMLLTYAGKAMRNDKELVIEAVRRNGAALADASKDLKGDKEVVLLAMRSFPGALKWASRKLQNDASFCLSAMEVAKTMPIDIEAMMAADLHKVKHGWGAVKEVVGNDDDDLNEFIHEAQAKNIQVGHGEGLSGLEDALMADLGRVKSDFGPESDEDDDIAAFRKTMSM